MRSKSNLNDLISSMHSQSEFHNDLSSQKSFQGRESRIHNQLKKFNQGIEVFDEMMDEEGSDNGDLRNYLS